MSEYWKSVPRKFCDFCKCWITDNKPSIDFHERGKRHKENVELRLKEVRKRSLQQSKDDEQIKAQMDKMEQAALEAFKKDLKDNPELAAQYGVSLEPKPGSAQSSTTNTDDGETVKKKKKKVKKKEWYEAKSPEGYSYYWSTVTGESKWDAPDDFMSLAEQKEAEEEAKEVKKSKPATATSPSSSKDLSQKNKQQSVSVTKESSHAVTDSTPSQIKAKPMSSGFGGWEVVKEVERPQMYDETSAPPELDEIPLPMPGGDTVAEQEPKKSNTVKEKVVTLGPSSSGPVAFKKRRIGGAARNVRQRTDD